MALAERSSLAYCVCSNVLSATAVIRITLHCTRLEPLIANQTPVIPSHCIEMTYAQTGSSTLNTRSSWSAISGSSGDCCNIPITLRTPWAAVSPECEPTRRQPLPARLMPSPEPVRSRLHRRQRAQSTRPEILCAGLGFRARESTLSLHERS